MNLKLKPIIPAVSREFAMFQTVDVEKLKIQDLNREGAYAFKQGIDIEACPANYIGSMSMYHWKNGWLDAHFERRK